MIFLVLNAIIFAALIAYSFTIETRRDKKNETNFLVNMVLFLAAVFGMMALTIGFCFYAPAQLALTFGKITYMLFGWFSVSCCVYMLAFPGYIRTTAGHIVQWVLNIFALYVIFFVKGGITSISITYDGTFQVASNLMFSGKFGRALMVTWFQFYTVFYLVAMPLFTCLMVLVKSENSASIVTRQKLRIAVAGVFASFVVFAFVKYCSMYQPMLRSLILVGFMPELMAFLYIEKHDEIWDKKFVLRGGLRFIVKYFLPGILIGLFFMLSWPIFSRNQVLFLSLYTVEIMLILTLWYFAGKYIEKKGLLQDSRYEKNFSEEISAITFDNEPEAVASRVFSICNKYIDTQSLRILIDSGDGYLQYIYSSDVNDEKKPVELNNEAFDKLLNINKKIVFRDMLLRDYTIAAVKIPLLTLLNETHSDGFILLSEGRHIFGLLLLGEKGSGNVYNDYDYKVFTDLYSNFFVIGYYMKNMLNQSVVGTVNREIKMSGQIITSIQENMDLIKHDKIDEGYLMVPAHNIGGEFVDTIRLTDNRYIFIIGALSGKGIAASMNMVILKSIIRTYLAETTDFKLLVQKVNWFIRESLPKGTFFAGTFGLVDFSSDIMYYINCGSPALFLYTRAYNNIIEIQGEGHILGFVSNISDIVKVKKVKLAPGDIVFSCTDGLIDTKSLRGEMFGKGRIQNEIMENRTYPARKMAQFTYDSLLKFTSTELEDDVTIFLMKYLVSEEQGKNGEVSE